MSEVRRSGDYEQWVKFFLRAVIASSESAIETIRALSELQVRNKKVVEGMGRASKTAARVLGYFEAIAGGTISRISTELQLSYNTVRSAVKRLCEAGILCNGGKVFTSQVYYYKEYIDILRSGTE